LVTTWPKLQKNEDQEKGDQLLRPLKTPPDPGHKARASESDQKQKPGGNPAKNNRPEEDS
jgi:hypothetical protein